jgi:hypothetical protein
MSRLVVPKSLRGKQEAIRSLSFRGAANGSARMVLTVSFVLHRDVRNASPAFSRLNQQRESSCRRSSLTRDANSIAAVQEDVERTVGRSPTAAPMSLG